MQYPINIAVVSVTLTTGVVAYDISQLRSKAMKKAITKIDFQKR